MSYFQHWRTFVRARLGEVSTVLTVVAGAIPAAVGMPSPYCWVILIAAAMQAMVPAKQRPTASGPAEGGQ